MGRRTSMGVVVALAGLMASAASCATHSQAAVVRAGERVAVAFTCRDGAGRIAATTEQGVTKDLSVPKSPIFLARRDDLPPVMVTAGQRERETSFEEALVSRIAEGAAGRAVGTPFSIEISGDSNRRDPSRTIRYAAVRRRPKSIRMPVAEFRERTGKEPAAGQPFTIDPLVPGRIDAVADGNVEIRFQAQKEGVVDTPVGPGVLRDRGERFEIELLAKPGDLLRGGPSVGRVLENDGTTLVVDYGEPLGGGKYRCEVTILPPTVHGSVSVPPEGAR